MRVPAAALVFLLAACSDGSAPPDSGGGGETPAPPSSSLGGCQIFPADNAWNRDVSGDPVAGNSSDFLAQMSPGNSIHLDLGTNEEYYGIPWTVVPASQPMVTIEYGTDGADYSDESDPGPMPIPLNAPIEGGSADDPDPSSGDRHVLVIQQESCVLYELYNAVRTSGGFRVSSSARWDLKMNATRPAGWTSADAAGLPILPGLLKHGEAASGSIDHAASLHDSTRAPRLRRPREPLRAVFRREPATVRHASPAQGRLLAGSLHR